MKAKQALTRLLASLLICSIGLQPALAEMRPAASRPAEGGKFSAPEVSRAVLAINALTHGPRLLPLQLLRLDVASPSTTSAPLPAPTAPKADPSAPRVLQNAPHAAASLPGALNAPQPTVKTPDAGVPTQAPGSEIGHKIQEESSAAAEAVRDIGTLSSDATRAAAQRQIGVLTGERRIPGRAAAGQAPVPMSVLRDTLRASFLRPQVAGEAGETAKPEVPAPKDGVTQVFKDPERNRSFWRYVLGYAIFLFGFEMYMVGLPYLISSLTKNSLREHNDPRLAVEETVKAVIRQNRSLARIAHWTAQAVSYATIPLFSKKAEEGPRKWLVRAMLVRAAVLALVPAVFFASGILSLQAAFLVLFLILAAQSFFQGIAVIMETAAVTRIIGDQSVTPAERTKANAILTFVAAAIAIIAPAIAGHISLIRNFFGKTGVGGAVIYGIYSASVAGAGLVYATIRMFAGQNKTAAAAPAAGEQASPAPSGLGGALKKLWLSLKDGIKLVFKNRFLRVMLGLSLINALFSDPLVFNVLPEYVESLIHSQPAVGAILDIPVIGWLVKGLTSTPMGYFSFMVVLSSVGSIVAAALIKPLRRLLERFGFKTEESMLLPFYALAAIEVPLFWIMLHWPSMAGVLVLYGLQTLVTSFGLITVSGLEQKTLGSYKDDEVNKLLAGRSFLAILAAIASTLVYGFLLNGIAIQTSMLIAAIAITVQGALRLAVPWLSFTKEERRRQPAPPPQKPA